MSLADLTRLAVLAAIDEHDRLGRESSPRLRIRAGTVLSIAVRRPRIRLKSDRRRRASIHCARSPTPDRCRFQRWPQHGAARRGAASRAGVGCKPKMRATPGAEIRNRKRKQPIPQDRASSSRDRARQLTLDSVIASETHDHGHSLSSRREGAVGAQYPMDSMSHVAPGATCIRPAPHPLATPPSVFPRSSRVITQPMSAPPSLPVSVTRRVMLPPSNTLKAEMGSFGAEPGGNGSTGGGVTRMVGWEGPRRSPGATRKQR